ncbi:nucleotide-diphospho-sugar transferase [Radiomyces spectabilis]|uniref:nucleotide-diphospho-sugar transferase n=1 Tax=Radiomyces spectabilis TaxID=64574 RepID=UPI00221FA78B|nr:nucleotide-diphospho-sugar transferase [Radiomyces spectabilis]KAI8384290.1 nucleotide-diphospho-sugar transferase [Radiomyces spectabilis]
MLGIQRPVSPPVKATFLVVAQNHERDGILSTILQIEKRFNHQFHYPYVVLSPEPLTDAFRNAMATATKAKVIYGTIDDSLWTYDDAEKANNASTVRQLITRVHRFYTGFMHRHSLLQGFDYYWRVEPNVEYHCDIDYDIFQWMKNQRLQHGWALATMATTEASLHDTWVSYSNHIRSAVLDNEFVTDESTFFIFITDNGAAYNGCQFGSALEIGSMEYMRTEEYDRLFRFLEQSGISYGRETDVALRMFMTTIHLRKNHIHFFNDIGVSKGGLTHCPSEKYLSTKCHCPQPMAANASTCQSRFENLRHGLRWDEETYRRRTQPQRLPIHLDNLKLTS